MNTKERIKELCKKNGTSLNRLETELSFGRGYLSKLDKSTPNVKNMQKIADHFNVSVDYLMNGTEEDYYTPETAAIAQEIFENKELRLLFDSAKDADPSDLQTVHEMLLALKRKERHDG